MITNEQDKEIKFVSEPQIALYSKLLQSSTFTKTERDKLMAAISGKITTTYDASLLISKLLMDIKFRKYFIGDRKHKIACCSACKSKLNVSRYLNIADHSRIWICEICKANLSKIYIPASKALKCVVKQLDAQGSIKSEKPYFPSEDVETMADEKQEAAADLHRKYNFSEAQENANDERRYEEKADAAVVADYESDKVNTKFGKDVLEALEIKNGN